MHEKENRTDSELVRLLSSKPELAWSFLLEKYSSRIYGLFRHWGLEHREASDCFSEMCRHLSSDDFRSLKDAEDLASRGSLFPWLRALAQRFAVEWVDTEAGRARIQETIEDLSDSQKALFELYFLEGCAPPEIRKRLQPTAGSQGLLVEVLEQLDELLEILSRIRLWRLLSQLARWRRQQREQQSDESSSEQEDPEVSESETSDEFKRLWQAWASLDSRTALTLQLRFDDCQSIPQISQITGTAEEQVRGSVRSGLLRLRRSTTQ